jgi:aminoglycoside phosphotransferase (APT) family kinase protein
VPDPVAEGLRSWLAARDVEARVEVQARTTVGLSQETWLIRVTSADGPVDAVLRLPTPASGSRAVLTQRVALQAVAGLGLPVPALLWFDDGEDNAFERPFIVMERVRGEVPVGWHQVPEPARTRLGEEAIDVLAALHGVDPAPLAAHARGRTLPSSLEWVKRRLDRVRPLPPVLDAALWWLERHAPPPPTRHVIAHGDYRMGNLIVRDDRIAAVLDWELAAPGDAASDLTWCFIAVWEPAGVDEEALLARYAERARTPLDPARIHWYRVLGYVRLAYYALSGARAFDSGASDDLRLAALRLHLPLHLDRLAGLLAGEAVR